MPFNIVQRYYNHYGVDLRSNELTRPTSFAADMLNCQYTASGVIEKRKGYKAIAPSTGGYGLYTFYKYDTATGSQTPEILTIDENLHRYIETTFLVAYTGAAVNCAIDLYLESSTSTFVCQILEDTVLVLDYDLGVGVDEVTPITLANLKTQIDALTGFAATITGDSTIPAAFLTTAVNEDLVAGDVTLTAMSSEQVNSPITDPFATYYAARNGTDFENVSAVQLKNVMFFGSGYEEIYKYDGQNLYRAGLPTPASIAAADAGAGLVGSAGAGDYVWKIQYEQIDAAGNIITGNVLDSAVAAAVNLRQFNLTIANVLAASGFNTNCAIVAGAQAAVNTITVDDGSGGSHTMKAGDTAYFYDGVSASYVTRTVSTVAAGTITVSGAAVTVANNAVISNNLRIVVWRSKEVASGSTPTLFYLLADLPNNSFAATQVYNDNIADASLGALYEPPATDRTTPPKGKYVSQWNGILMIAGNLDNPNNLYYSDIDSCEYFPAGGNALLLESSVGDVITGIKNSNEIFCVFKERSFATVSGEITTGQVRVEFKALNLGGTSHASIAQINSEVFWPSQKGPRRSNGGSSPFPLGLSTDPTGKEQDASRIDTIVNDSNKTDQEKFKFKRSVGINFSDEQKYVFFVPAETTTGTTVHPNDNSRAYVYDYTRDAWLIWDGINAQGGFCRIGQDLYHQERRYSTALAGMTYHLYKRQRNYNAFDYADHAAAIECSYQTQWEALNNPVVLKKFTNIRLLSFDITGQSDFTLTVQQELNYEVGNFQAEFDIEISSYGWGVGPWGTIGWGGTIAGVFMHGLARKRAKSSRITFSNSNLNENIYLTGWEVEAATPYQVEMKP
jgi:hypothetical protein